MAGAILPILPKRTFELSSDDVETTIVVQSAIDISRYRQVTLQARLHGDEAENAGIRLVLKPVQLAREAGNEVYQDDQTGGGQIYFQPGEGEWLKLVSMRPRFGAHVRFQVVLSAWTDSTCRFTVSADLVVRE